MSDADRIRELEARVADLIENPSDAYHTMEELYDYRMLYNAMAANAYPQFSVKSRKHHDGEYCFGGEYFIVVMTIPTKLGYRQVSNHYKNDCWDYFKVSAIPEAPIWDGHTPEEAAERLRDFLIGDFEGQFYKNTNNQQHMKETNEP